METDAGGFDRSATPGDIPLVPTLPVRPIRAALAGVALAASVAAAAPARAQAPRLFYEQEGEGPAVIFVEEWAHDTSIWFRVLPPLRDGFRLVRYDLRGQGRSEPPEDGDYSVEAQRRDLERVMDALGVESAHLVGMGLGARIAVEEARRRPDRVRSLVLVQPRLWIPESDRPWWERLAEAWARVGSPSLGEYSSVLVQRWVGSNFASLNPWVPPFYDLMLRREAAAPLMDALRAWLDLDLPEGAVPRQVPVLVVTGEDGPAPGPGVASTLTSGGRVRIPHSRWPVVDAPDALVGPVRDFLASSEAHDAAQR